MTIKRVKENIEGLDHADKILKRVRGIITGFNADNAESKLKNLSAMLNSLKGSRKDKE